MVLGASAIEPLLRIVRHGGDEARKHALASLRILAIDRDARERIAAADGRQRLLSGLARFGPAELRASASELNSVLDMRQSVALDARGHAKQARATRVGQSKLRHSRLVRRGVEAQEPSARVKHEGG